MSSSAWITLIGGGGLTAVTLAMIGVAYRSGYHAGSDDPKWQDADRRLTRLEKHEGYDTPESK